jgi:hypothetical protein
MLMFVIKVHLNNRDAILRDDATNPDLFAVDVYYYSYIIL